MPILEATSLGHSFGAIDLFADVSLRLERRDRVGLVGPNGSGKTTLLLNLAGQLTPTAGVVAVQQDLTLGYLHQEAVLTFTGQDNSVFEEMLVIFADLQEMEARLRELEAAMAEGDSSAELFDTYGDIQAEYDASGGYQYQVEIKRILQGLGFPPEEWNTPLAHLSGGQKTRLLLGRLLLEKPDLLILDEPTNHLDLPAIEWLERTLRSWVGALIIVSHDRYFLDAVVNQVWELKNETLRVYKGNYSSFVQQRQEAWERELALFAAEKERMTNELDFIRKHIAGGKRDIAKGKLKRLTRDIILMEQVGVTGREGKSWLEIGGRVRTFHTNEAARRLRDLPAPDSGPPPLRIRLQPELRSARSVLRARTLVIGFPGKPLFTSAPIQLNRRDCAAVMGPNGSGKSTLLRTILGKIEPLEGSLKFGDGVQVGYFAQAHEQLNDRNKVLDELLANKPMSVEDGRNYLAQYQFRGDDVFKNISDLSGGERARLALALLAATGANFLLLDEPTNHLDIPSQEILQVVLEKYTGTILLVTHDRYLIDRLANQIWEIRDNQMVSFTGGYEDYLRFRDNPDEEGQDAGGQENIAWVEDIQPQPVGKKALREARHRRYVLQGMIEDHGFHIQYLQAELRNAQKAGDMDKVTSLEAQIGNLTSELASLNAELDALLDV